MKNALAFRPPRRLAPVVLGAAMLGIWLIGISTESRMARAVDSSSETLITVKTPQGAPGTPVPEIGGLLPRDVQVIIRSLAGKDVIGADICEVAPCYDPTGITCVAAANLMFEMLCVMAVAAAKAKAGKK